MIRQLQYLLVAKWHFEKLGDKTVARFRLPLQTNSVIDRTNIQAVFVYRYQPPFGTFQLAYQRGTAEFGQRSEQGNTLFLKLTTVL
jgi:hypothetical protein